MCLKKWFQADRPHWGDRQVRTLKGIKPGQIYRVEYSHLDGHGSNILVLSEPFQDSEGIWWFEYTRWPLDEEFNFITEACCSDKGIVAYEDGQWNSTNSMHRTGRKCLSVEKVDEIRSGLEKVE